MVRVSESMQGALSAALAHHSWTDTIDGVKSIVTKHLEGLHSGATVRKTVFFNHTFAPDLTLSWEDADAAERQVFLRLPMISDTSSQASRVTFLSARSYSGLANLTTESAPTN